MNIEQRRALERSDVVWRRPRYDSVTIMGVQWSDGNMAAYEVYLLRAWWQDGAWRWWVNLAANGRRVGDGVVESEIWDGRWSARCRAVAAMREHRAAEASR